MTVAVEGRLQGPFWRYFAAATLTNIADGIRAGAFPLLAAVLTRDPLGVAAVFAAQHGAWLLFGLYAGAVADRCPPTRILLVADGCRVTVLALLLGCVAAGAASIPLLAGAAFLIGTAETFRDTAAPSLLSRLVPDPLLERATGRLVSGEVVGNEFLGPLLGAALFAGSMALPVAIDGLVLAFAVALVLSLPRTVHLATAAPAPVPGDRRLRTALGTGIRWLMRHRLLRTVTAAGALLAFADAAWWAVLVVFAGDVLHLPPQGYGLLLAAGAAGGAGGGLAAERLARWFRPVPLLVGTILVAGLPTLALMFSPPLWLVLPLLAVSSAGFAVWNVVAFATRQRRTPARLFGRVTSVHRMALYGGATLGALCGGWIAGAGLTSTFGAAAALTVAAAGLQLTVWSAETDGEPPC
ncbi:MFS transporter [Nonomuraea sp. H19]|uniref:MFS transporter n=1 Tax=Nonomuraea sp. H19 TaxID=3452206 RepID=UPI003F89BDF6